MTVGEEGKQPESESNEEEGVDLSMDDCFKVLVNMSRTAAIDDEFIEGECQRQQEDLGHSLLSENDNEIYINIVSMQGFMWSFADVCDEPTGKMSHKPSML